MYDGTSSTLLLPNVILTVHPKATTHFHASCCMYPAACTHALSLPLLHPVLLEEAFRVVPTRASLLCSAASTPPRGMHGQTVSALRRAAATRTAMPTDWRLFGCAACQPVTSHEVDWFVRVCLGSRRHRRWHALLLALHKCSQVSRHSLPQTDGGDACERVLWVQLRSAHRVTPRGFERSQLRTYAQEAREARSVSVSSKYL
jgi:hypothetical protein